MAGTDRASQKRDHPGDVIEMPQPRAPRVPAFVLNRVESERQCPNIRILRNRIVLRCDRLQSMTGKDRKDPAGTALQLVQFGRPHVYSTEHSEDRIAIRGCGQRLVGEFAAGHCFRVCADRVVPDAPDRLQYGVLLGENNRHRPATARWHLVPQCTLRVANLSFRRQMADFRHCRRFVDRDESGRMPAEPPDPIRRTLRSCAIQGGSFRCRQMQFADSTAAI